MPSHVLSIKTTNYAIPTSGNVYFVAPEGSAGVSSSASTSSMAAPITMRRALALISALPASPAVTPANTTIVLKGGTYRQEAYGIRKNITIQAAPGEKPHFNGLKTFSGFVSDPAGYYKLTNYTNKFARLGGSGIDTVNFPQTANRQGGFMDGVAMTQAKSAASMVAGQFFADDVNNILYVKNNPAGKTVEMFAGNMYSASGDNLVGALDVSSTGSQSVVKGIGISGYPSVGYYISNGGKLIDSTVSYCNAVGVFLKSGNCLIDGCLIEQNGECGIQNPTGVSLMRDVIIRNTTITTTNDRIRYAKTWSTGAVKLCKVTNSLIEKCNVRDNNCSGIWFDVDAIDNRILENVVENNIIGIFYEIAQNGYIGRNIIRNNNSGVNTDSSSGVIIVNNTFDGNERNISIRDLFRRDDEPGKTELWVSRDVAVRNNLFLKGKPDTSGNGSAHVHTQTVNGSTDPASAFFSTLNYNVYWRSGSGMPTHTAIIHDATRNTYTTLAALKTAYPQFEPNGKESNETANPHTDANYNLLAGSSARGAGAPLSATTASKVGLPAGVVLDAGAKQAAAAAPDSCQVRVDAAVESVTVAKDAVISDLEERLETSQELVSTQTQTIARLNSSLTAAQNSVSSLNSQVITLTSERTTALNQVSSLTAQVNSLNSQLANANATILSLQASGDSAQIAALSAQVTELSAQLELSQDSLSSIKTSVIADLQDYKARLAPPIYTEIDADILKYR